MAELSGPGGTLETGVARAVAVLHGRPELWSYSALKEIEACPRRYVLTQASYPELWDRTGYPSIPSIASLFGDTVHSAVEQILRALVAGGCETFGSSVAVEILKPLGGIHSVVKAQMDTHLRSLDVNPRLSENARNRLARALSDRAEEARAQVQEFLCRMAFPPIVRTTSGPSTDVPKSSERSKFLRRPLTRGTYTEITLVAKELRVQGRVDLLTVNEQGVTIIDYKTGTSDPSHLEQVKLYALLWEHDEVANPGRIPIKQLQIAYPGDSQNVEINGLEDFDAMEDSVRSRVMKADVAVDQVVPDARPETESCHFCQVKGLCDIYWSQVVPEPEDLEEGEWFDFEGVVGPTNGIRSTWMLDPGTRKKTLLLRTPQNLNSLQEGRTVRLLGIRREVDPETDACVALMTSSSELLILNR